MNVSSSTPVKPTAPPPPAGAPEESATKPSPSGLDALTDALPRSQGVAAKLAAASRSKWLTIGAPVAVVAVAAGTALAVWGGWLAPSGAPLQDPGREDLTRGLLYGDRSDGPDRPAAAEPQPGPSAPTRTDGPDRSPSASEPSPGETGPERSRERERGAPREGASSEPERSARPFAPFRR